MNGALQTEPTQDLNIPSVCRLSAAEIEALLSDSKTDFEEIPTNTNIATCTNQNDICVTGVQKKENVHAPAPASNNVHMLVNNVQPWNNSTLNLCPNINNCIVNFNIQK